MTFLRSPVFAILAIAENSYLGRRKARRNCSGRTWDTAQENSAGFCPETTQEAFACTGTRGGKTCAKLSRNMVVPPGSSLIV
jgi:hypothetical protein